MKGLNAHLTGDLLELDTCLGLHYLCEINSENTSWEVLSYFI